MAVGQRSPGRPGNADLPLVLMSLLRKTLEPSPRYPADLFRAFVDKPVNTRSLIELLAKGPGGPLERHSFGHVGGRAARPARPWSAPPTGSGFSSPKTTRSTASCSGCSWSTWAIRSPWSRMGARPAMSPWKAGRIWCSWTCRCR